VQSSLHRCAVGMSARGDVADDDFKRRAMEAYKAKGKGATVQAAAKMKVGAANTRRAMERSDSESSLSSESELSDEEAESPKSRGRRSRRHEDSLSDSDSDAGGKPEGFDDDTYGTEGAKLAKKMRQRVRATDHRLVVPAAFPLHLPSAAL
jgi:Arc/MetJ family transcription regulator